MSDVDGQSFVLSVGRKQFQEFRSVWVISAFKCIIIRLEKNVPSGFIWWMILEILQAVSHSSIIFHFPMQQVSSCRPKATTQSPNITSLWNMWRWRFLHEVDTFSCRLFGHVTVCSHITWRACLWLEVLFTWLTVDVVCVLTSILPASQKKNNIFHSHGMYVRQL